MKSMLHGIPWKRSISYEYSISFLSPFYLLLCQKSNDLHAMTDGMGQRWRRIKLRSEEVVDSDE